MTSFTCDDYYERDDFFVSVEELQALFRREEQSFHYGGLSSLSDDPEETALLGPNQHVRRHRLDASSVIRAMAANDFCVARTKMVQWAYDVVDHFQLSREVVEVTMKLVDRFVVIAQQQQTAVSKAMVVATAAGGASADIVAPSHYVAMTAKAYQYHVLAALYVALKVARDNKPPHGVSDSYDYYYSQTVFSSEQLCQLSRGEITAEQLESMERDLMEALEWRLTSPPTSKAFLYGYLAALFSWEAKQDNALKSQGCAYLESKDSEQLPMPMTLASTTAATTMLHTKTRNVAEYLLELAVYDLSLCDEHAGSILAMAALTIALENVVQVMKTSPSSGNTVDVEMSPMSKSSNPSPHMDPLSVLKQRCRADEDGTPWVMSLDREEVERCRRRLFQTWIGCSPNDAADTSPRPQEEESSTEETNRARMESPVSVAMMMLNDESETGKNGDDLCTGQQGEGGVAVMERTAATNIVSGEASSSKASSTLALTTKTA